MSDNVFWSNSVFSLFTPTKTCFGSFAERIWNIFLAARDVWRNNFLSTKFASVDDLTATLVTAIVNGERTILLWPVFSLTTWTSKNNISSFSRVTDKPSLLRHKCISFVKKNLLNKCSCSISWFFLAIRYTRCFAKVNCLALYVFFFQ